MGLSLIGGTVGDSESCSNLGAQLVLLVLSEVLTICVCWVLGAHLVLLVLAKLVMCCIAGCLARTWCKRVVVLVSPMELQDMYVLMHDKLTHL